MTGPQMGGRRSTLEIVYDIFSVCLRGGANKTDIKHQSKLSDDQLRQYLALLADQEFLYRNDEGCFEVTEKGEVALDQAGAICMLQHLHEDGSDNDRGIFIRSLPDSECR
ncbi:MAG: hypothetical protein HY532_07460 [Chloroflexi bacterium]|nr:hypothetical protein [Chloroflexota bacterium]